MDRKAYEGLDGIYDVRVTTIRDGSDGSATVIMKYIGTLPHEILPHDTEVFREVVPAAKTCLFASVFFAIAAIGGGAALGIGEGSPLGYVLMAFGVGVALAGACMSKAIQNGHIEECIQKGHKRVQDFVNKRRTSYTSYAATDGAVRDDRHRNPLMSSVHDVIVPGGAQRGQVPMHGNPHFPSGPHAMPIPGYYPAHPGYYPAPPGYYPAPPGYYPGTIPGSMPGSIPGSVPGSIPGSMPGSIPGSMPGSIPGSFPGSIPGSMPLTATASPVAASSSSKMDERTSLLGNPQ